MILVRSDKEKTISQELETKIIYYGSTDQISRELGIIIRIECQVGDVDAGVKLKLRYLLIKPIRIFSEISCGIRPTQLTVLIKCINGEQYSASFINLVDINKKLDHFKDADVPVVCFLAAVSPLAK